MLKTDWRLLFLEKTQKLEKQAQARTLGTFKKVFVDSWRKANIMGLIRKLDLSFQVSINNEIKYFVPGKKLQFN